MINYEGIEKLTGIKISRREKRNLEREVKKKQEVVDKMTPLQLEIMNDITITRATEMVEDLRYKLDACITAAVLLETDLKLLDIHKIFKLSADLIEELEIKLEKLEKLGGNEEMASKKQLEIQEKVREKATELIQKGASKKEAIEILMSQFPTLAKSMLVNAYAKVKETIEPVEFENEEEKEAVEEILEIIEGKEEVKEDVKVVKEEMVVRADVHKVDLPLPVIPMPDVNSPKEEVVEFPSKLKIVKSHIELDGEFGHYSVVDGEVSVGELIFKNLDELAAYRAAEIEIFEKKMKELREVFEVAGVN